MKGTIAVTQGLGRKDVLDDRAPTPMLLLHSMGRTTQQSVAQPPPGDVTSYLRSLSEPTVTTPSYSGSNDLFPVVPSYRLQTRDEPAPMSSREASTSMAWHPVATGSSVWEWLAALRSPETAVHEAGDLAETLARFALERDEAEWAEALVMALATAWPRRRLVMLLDTLVDFGVTCRSSALRQSLENLLGDPERSVFLSSLYMLLHGVVSTRAEAEDLRTKVPEARRALFDACWKRLEEEEALPGA